MPSSPASPYVQAPFKISTYSAQSSPTTPRSYDVTAHLKSVQQKTGSPTYVYSTKPNQKLSRDAEISKTRPGSRDSKGSLRNTPRTPVTKHPLFYINRTGLPLTGEVLEKMTNFCIDRTSDRPEIQEKIQNFYKRHFGLSRGTFSPLDTQIVPAPPKPPVFNSKSADQVHPYGGSNRYLAAYVEKCQFYMFSLKYNHTGMQFYDIAKSRSLTRLMEVAKAMIKYALPIKCLEAVILGVHLTNDCPTDLVRFTLSFKSKHLASKTSHYHVLLGIYVHRIGYGCIGMSRKRELAFKSLDGRYQSLEDLIFDIKASYETCGHRLKRVSFGLPIIHDSCSLEAIDWKTLIIDAPKGSYLEHADMQKRIEKFSKLMRIDNKS